MKNKLKSQIEYCGLNYSSEMRKLVLINIVSIITALVFFFLTKQINIVVSVSLLALVIDYLIISNYSTKVKLLDEERENEFVTIISYFEIFISNGNNVYQSFTKTISYCSDWMKDIMSNLLKDIDGDKTIQPFINFANNFKLKIVTNIMLSIYTMVDQGESFEQINQFQILFEQLQKSKRIENLEKKQRSLSILASLPLVGAAGMTITLTISVIQIIGELVNVI
ncbi:MAG: hypothetical protein J6T15_01420 [Bacilli bacterium]|nr:hypothetical protein [Bacilli bacterium]